MESVSAAVSIAPWGSPPISGAEWPIEDFAVVRPIEKMFGYPSSVVTQIHEDDQVHKNFEPSSVQQDFRHRLPKDWSEVNALQKALTPCFEMFARMTCRTTPKISPWLSYASQVNELQQMLTYYWGRDGRLGHPPYLARLTEESSEKYIHPDLRQWKSSDGSLLWWEERYNQTNFQCFDKTLQEIRAKSIRKEKLGEHVSEPAQLSESESESENLSKVLKSIVARNPDRFRAWLSSIGYEFYAKAAHTIEWNPWCTWIAPTLYERLSVPQHLESRFGSGRVNLMDRRMKFQPAITLEEAFEGYKRWSRTTGRSTSHVKRLRRVKGGPPKTHVAPADINPSLARMQYG